MTTHRIPLACAAALTAALALGGCSLPSSSASTDSAEIAAMYDEFDATMVKIVREAAPDFTRDLNDDEVLAVLHNTCDELAIADEENVVDILLASGVTLEETGSVLGAAVGGYC